MLDYANKMFEHSVSENVGRASQKASVKKVSFLHDQQKLLSFHRLA